MGTAEPARPFPAATKPHLGEGAPGPAALVALDPQIAPHEGHFRYLWDQYNKTLDSITKHEGKLETFALGHHRFGITRENGLTFYREWAPGAVAAQLIGDFNGWAGTWMQRDEFGVYTVELPDGETLSSRKS